MKNAKPRFYPKNVGEKGKRGAQYSVIAKEWWDRTYGNSYNSLRIFRDGELIAVFPMVYGYGDYYLQRAMEWAKDYFSDLTGNERYYEIFKIYSKHERCLKREVIAWGKHK